MFTISIHPDRAVEVSAKLATLVEALELPMALDSDGVGGFVVRWKVEGEGRAAVEAERAATLAFQDALAITGIARRPPHSHTFTFRVNAQGAALQPEQHQAPVICIRCGGETEGYDHTPRFCAAARSLRDAWK